MIRNFDWRDLPLLHRIRNRGLCLDSRMSYTSGPHALQYAILDSFRSPPATCTLVARSGQESKEAALGQIHLYHKLDHARLAFVGPQDACHQPSGIQLLEALSHAAGEEGVHSLIAEVNEDKEIFEALRKVGFAVYARQRIWSLGAETPEPQKAYTRAWRMETPSDQSAVIGLYSSLVPALVQQIEPLASMDGNGLVYWSEGEILGYLDVHRGSKAIWVQPYFHPAVDIDDGLIGGFVLALRSAKPVPIHVCVRSYQGGMSGALENLGFDSSDDQAVMVKRLAQPLHIKAEVRTAGIEGTRPEPSTPFINSTEEHRELTLEGGQ